MSKHYLMTDSIRINILINKNAMYVYAYNLIM